MEIDALREAAGVPDDTYQKYYYPLVVRYARAVHLLPASEMHHHRHIGGLFTHGLETATHALRHSEDVLVAGLDLPRKRKLIESRFRWSVFAAAMLHDAGKPLTDMVVTDPSGTRVWQPMRQLLADWLDTEAITEYHLTWRAGRYRKHEGLALQMALKIMPEDLWTYVAEAGPDLLAELQSAIGRTGSMQGKLYELATAADQASVAANLRRAPGPGLSGFPAEQLVIDAMRRLIQQSEWTVNTDNAQVWVLQDGAYVLWPQAALEVIASLVRDGIAGVPRDPDLLADLLVERGLAQRNEAEHRNTWDIRPALLTQRLPTAYLRALKFTTETLFTVPPLPAESAVTTKPATDQESRTPVGQKPAVREPMKPGRESAQQSLPFDQTPQTTAETTQGEPGTPAMMMSPVATEKPMSPDTRSDDVLAATAWLEQAPKQVLRQVFLAFVTDLKKGVRREGIDAVFLADGAMALAWPQAIRGYGVEQRDLLSCLQESGWIVPDPGNPLRNVVDIEFHEGSRKALIMAPQVGRHIRALANQPVDRGVDTQQSSAIPNPPTVGKESDIVRDILTRTATYGPPLAAFLDGQSLVIRRAVLTRYANEIGSRVVRVREALQTAQVKVRLEPSKTATSKKEGARDE